MAILGLWKSSAGPVHAARPARARSGRPASFASVGHGPFGGGWAGSSCSVGRWRVRVFNLLKMRNSRQNRSIRAGRKENKTGFSNTQRMQVVQQCTYGSSQPRPPLALGLKATTINVTKRKNHHRKCSSAVPTLRTGTSPLHTQGTQRHVAARGIDDWTDEDFTLGRTLLKSSLETRRGSPAVKTNRIKNI